MAGVAISDHELFRRGAALAVVIVLHALLIAAWSQLSAKRRAASHSQERRGVLMILEVERDRPPLRAARDSVTTTPPGAAQDEIETTAITIPTTPQSVASDAPPAPPIDWRLEAERSGRAAVVDAARAGPRAFGPPLTPAPTPQPKEFEWDPEPSRVGVAGGLPFVRLGKRCVVGLGFFGCAIGDLPEANGRLFEGMRDPDRHESSVPDPQE